VVVESKMSQPGGAKEKYDTDSIREALSASGKIHDYGL
jgi:hypothetical protein